MSRSMWPRVGHAHRVLHRQDTSGDACAATPARASWPAPQHEWDIRHPVALTKTSARCYSRGPARVVTAIADLVSRGARHTISSHHQLRCRYREESQHMLEHIIASRCIESKVDLQPRHASSVAILSDGTSDGISFTINRDSSTESAPFHSC